MPEPSFVFGPFQLLPARRLLLERGKSVALGGRALDILIALVECAGTTVSKEQLTTRVWPDTVVAEANLRVHIAALRKALGDGRDGRRFISNTVGRGYSFVAEIEDRPRPPEPSETSTHASSRIYNLPAPLTGLIGRAETVRSLITQLAQQRLVTIAGPGGIGKTTVAIAVADALASSYRDGVAFVALASVRDAGLVLGTIAEALGIQETGGRALMDRLHSHLRSSDLLLVLDDCVVVVD